MKKSILLCLCLVWSLSGVYAVEVTDVLTATEIHGSGYSSRQTYTSPESGVEYVYASASNKTLIQINDPSKSGIAVSRSRGTLKSLVVVLNQNCTKGYSIYASTEPYGSYTNTVSKDMLISNGLGVSPDPLTETTTFSDGEKSFYIRPGSSATYIKSITVVWDIVPQADAPVINSSNGFVFYPSTDVTFEAAAGATVYYSIDSELTQENYQTVGQIYSGMAVALDKDATIYTLAVEDGKDPSDVVSQQFTRALRQSGYVNCIFSTGLYTYQEGTNGTKHEDVPFDQLIYQTSGSNSFVQPIEMVQWGDFIFGFENSGSNKAAYYSGNPGELRVYNAIASTMLSSLDVSKMITKVVFHMASSTYSADFASCSLGTMALDKDAHTLTWTDENGSACVVFGKASAQQRWTSVDIYYEKTIDANTSFSPVFSSSNGMEFYPSTEISIAAAEGSGSDVKIYYNVNADEDPTPETGTLYDGPFSVTETSVVKAIAVDGAKNPSDVVRLDVKRRVERSFENIAALLSADPAPVVTDVVRMTEPVTVTGSYTLTNGNAYYLYVKDASGELLIYSTEAFPDSYVPGAVIGDFVMTYQVYRNLPEGIATDYIASFAEPLRVDRAPQPETVTAVDASMYNHYVRFDDVSVVGGKIDIEPALTLQNKFANYKPLTWSDAKSYNITGMVGHDAGIDKLYYLSAEALPVGPSPRIYLEEDDLDLVTFETNTTFGIDVVDDSDVTIYYTVDGSDPIGNPAARVFENPVPITVTTTVKAYAKKAGMSPSDVVERTFVKTGSAIVYIKDFLAMTDVDTPLAFVGEVTVMAQSADYLFVEGILGDHLAIKASDGWNDKTYASGDRLTGFSITHPAQSLADVNLAEAVVSTFGDALSGDNPVYKSVSANDIMDIQYYGYPVIVYGAALEANELSDSGNGWSVNAVLPVDFTQFGTIDGWPVDAYLSIAYTIIGVVMPDADGVAKLWPMSIAVEGDDRTAVPNIVGAAQFEGRTTIEIVAVAGAAVYYTVDGSEPSTSETGSTRLYSAPFEITATTIVKAIAVADGKEPSAVVTARFVETITTGIEDVDAGSIKIYGSVGTIVAPDGAEIYDLSGRRIVSEHIVPGIYLVYYAGRVVKVAVR